MDRIKVETGIGNIGTLIGNVEFNIKLPKLKSSIEKLEKDFHKGEVKDSIEYLHSLLTEYSEYPQIKYQLLVKKALFLFSLRKYDEALSLLNNLETNYKQFIDLNYEEVKLIELSLNKKEKDFFNLVDKIISESSKGLIKQKFELMYYLNTNKIDKAKAIFEKLDKTIQEEKPYSLMGGHIYSSLYDAINTDKFYKIALAQDISFLDKASIYDYYSTNIINNLMYGQIIDKDYKETILSYKNIIEKILKQEEYFEESYIINLKNIYLYIFLALENDQAQYIIFYEKESHHQLIRTNHYFKYVALKNILVNHKEVQKEILSENIELLIQYCHLIEEEKNRDEVLHFLDIHLDLIYKNKYVLMFYIQGKILANTKVHKDAIKYLSSNKYASFEYILSYIRLDKNNSNKLDKRDINKLIEYASNEKINARIVMEAIYLLKDLGFNKEYIDLAIQKQTEFKLIISETLEICYQDKNLLTHDFETFLEKIIDKDKYLLEISNVYLKYHAYEKSFKYLYMIFQKGNQDKNFLLNILEISSHYFGKTKGFIDEMKQKEIYDCLIAKKSELDIENLMFVFNYSFEFLKDTKQILPTLNQKLLSTDINQLKEEIKIKLSKLYIHLITHLKSNYEQLFIYEENICYEKDGITYLKGYSIAKENEEKLSFKVVNNNNYFTIKNNSKYKKESLFHKIVSPFAFKVNNPNMLMKVDTKSDNPFSELFTFMEKQKKETMVHYQKYNSEEIKGLYLLAQHDYKNYFTLIPYLLNHNNNMLNSLKPNLIVDKRKILTLSSIIFLEEIGYLDKVLSRDDIVIQQTLINWLQDYIENFNFNTPQEYSYIDDTKLRFIPFTEKEAQKGEIFKKYIIDLTTKLLKNKIINDTVSNLPIGEFFYKVSEIMGLQEYHALAYCMEYNYQIISENNIFDILFDALKFNKLFISNSFALVSDILTEDENFKLKKKLFKHKYRYIENHTDEIKILQALKYNRFPNILNEKLILKFHIWYEYGYLDTIINDYKNIYKVFTTKQIFPNIDIFARNMEYLLEILEEDKT